MAPTVSKRERRAWTTDDLMRMQENREPPRKRHRLDMSPEVAESNWLDECEDTDDEALPAGDDLPLDDVYDDEESQSGSPEQDDTPSNVLSRLDTGARPGIRPAPAHDSLPPGLQVEKLAVPAPPSFSALGISPPLQAALASMSIRTPTPVQAACIPPLLSGRDCIGNAQTGSGKTVAFAIPILQRLSLDPYGIYALVLTPTRELAFQISEQFAALGAPFNLSTAVVVGGMDMIAQALELRERPHVVVATPGRIVDHLRSSSGEWDLSRVKFLVLDEADRLLTPTFAPELAELFAVLPKERQTCLFTATLTPAMETLADAPPRPGKDKPFIHRMDASSVETVETLKQHYILVPSHVREPYLYYLLRNPPESTIRLRRRPPEARNESSSRPKGSKRAARKGKGRREDEEEAEAEQPPPTIIFCARTRTAAYLTHMLKTLSIRSTALHSRLTQRERLASLSLFRSSVVPVLVSTDVGARGLDIQDVAMVINWDIPNAAEEYTHRVGRTARAGKGGVAISFVTERDEERVLRIEDRIKIKLAEVVLPESKVLEHLNQVSTAKRLANMELHDSNFGRRERVHKTKRNGMDDPCDHVLE